MKNPQLVAHRGYTLRYPENTLIGVEAAIRAGARYVEIDVQLSSDQVPVLFHDRKLQRICGEAGAVHDYPAAQLTRFKAMEFNRFGYKFATERIPTLAEFAELVARYPDVTAFVELKREALERFGPTTVLSRVRRALEGIQTRCVIISFDLGGLAAARAQWPAIGVVVDTWRERNQQAVKDLQPEYLFCDVDGLPRWGSLRFGKSRIVVYEVADPALALKLTRRGAEFIETFAVEEMRESLNP
jgi:glycerophosphoryl diester phosphodiesterase